MSHKWTATRHSAIAVNTLVYFQTLLSNLTKLWQCIQTIKRVPIFLNFSAWSAVFIGSRIFAKSIDKTNKGPSRSSLLRDTVLTITTDLKCDFQFTSNWPVLPGCPWPVPDDLGVDGARDAVVKLGVELGQGVSSIHAVVGDVTWNQIKNGFSSGLTKESYTKSYGSYFKNSLKIKNQ